MLLILSSLVCNLLQKRHLHINIGFEVTGWMLCVIPHIFRYVEYHSYSDHSKQVNNVIETLFCGLSEDKMAITRDIFGTEYIYFDKNSGSFDGDEFICKSEDIRDGNNHFWHKSIHFLAPRLLVLLHLESHKMFLLLVQQSVLGVI